MHNFMQQLAMWRVVIGGGVIVDYVGTHLHYSQLTM